MKKLLLAFFLSLLTTVSYSDVPKLLHYQGHLNDGQGIALGETHKLSFRLYDAEIQGNFLWKQDFQAVEIVNGNFAVLLDVSTASPALTFNQPYWLSIEVDDDGEMTPRQQIASSAYSINAQTVNGIPASATAQANNILPLNAQGKFPQTVLDIQQGSGGNFNADTVDGFHASSIPTANTLLPLDSSAKISLNVIPQDQGSGLNADKVDGNEASDFYNLDNERFSGTLLASHVEHDGLNADKVDGLEVGNASGQIPVSNGQINTNLNADLLDGKHLSDFLPALTQTNKTGLSVTYPVGTETERLRKDVIPGKTILVIATGIVDTPGSSYGPGTSTIRLYGPRGSVYTVATQEYPAGWTNTESFSLQMIVTDFSGPADFYLSLSTSGYAARIWECTITVLEF